MFLPSVRVRILPFKPFFFLAILAISALAIGAAPAQAQSTPPASALTWTPDESQFTSMGIHVPPPADNPNAPPGLFTAIQEQLGLKLEPRKTSAEVLVIDHVDRPSPN